MDTVLVTGGNGFVGSWCIVELLRQGYAVRATLRDLANGPALHAAVAAVAPRANGNLSFVRADLTADDGWGEAVDSCTAVLHVASPLGGTATADLVTPARDGTRRVLSASIEAGVNHVVMTSAAATARPPHGDDRVSDETIWASVDDPQFDQYRRSKILAERAAWDLANAASVPTQLTTILPGAVFGPILMPSQRRAVATIDALLQGRQQYLFRIGFWVVDVRDLAALHVRAIGDPAAFGQRFIAAGEFQWMEQVAATLREEFGERASRVPTTVLSSDAARELMETTGQLPGLAPMLDRTNPLTAAKARTILGFDPRPAREAIIACAERLLAE